MTALFCFIGTLSGNGGNCGVTSSRSRSFDVSSLIGLSPNDNSRTQRSGSCSPPTPAGPGGPDSMGRSDSGASRPAVVSSAGSRLAPHSSSPHPSPNVSVGPPAPPPPTAAAGAAGVAAAHAAAVAAMSAAYAGAGAGASGGAAPPGAPSGLHPFLLHPGLYQHLITGKQAIKADFNVLFFCKNLFSYNSLNKVFMF